MSNQQSMVLEYIKEFGSITPMEAFGLGITKLATRVSEMRKEGIEIEGETIAVKNRFGNTCYVKRYTLKESAV